MIRLSLSLFLVSAALPVLAQSADPEKQIEAINQKLEANSENAESLKKTTAEREAELANLQARLVETADSLREAEAKKASVERQLAALSAEEARLSESLANQQASISDVIAGLQSLEMSKPPALATSPEDAAKAARTAMLLSAMADELEARVERMKEDLSRIQDLRAEKQSQQAVLAQSEEELTARRGVLDRLLGEKKAQYEEVTGRVAKLEAENARLAREAEGIRDVVDRLADNARAEELLKQAESAAAQKAKAAALARRPALEAFYNLPDRFPDAKGRIPFPVTGLLNGKFGGKTGDGTRREGLEIETVGEALVVAPFGGEVVFARTLPRTGNVIILDVGSGYHIIMSGLSRFNVREGTIVKAGQPVGFMPGGDRASLFFQLRHQQEVLNPTGWLLDGGQTR